MQVPAPAASLAATMPVIFPSRSGGAAGPSCGDDVSQMQQWYTCQNIVYGSDDESSHVNEDFSSTLTTIGSDFVGEAEAPTEPAVTNPLMDEAVTSNAGVTTAPTMMPTDFMFDVSSDEDADTRHGGVHARGGVTDDADVTDHYDTQPSRPTQTSPSPMFELTTAVTEMRSWLCRAIVIVGQDLSALSAILGWVQDVPVARGSEEVFADQVWIPTLEELHNQAPVSKMKIPQLCSGIFILLTGA